MRVLWLAICFLDTVIFLLTPCSSPIKADTFPSIIIFNYKGNKYLFVF